VKDIKQILAMDLEKNYKDENITVDEYYAGIKKLEEAGTILKQVGNTLFIYDLIDDVSVEFHSCNAENKQNLMKNGNMFLASLSKKGCKKAITYYDNPKSTDLLDGFQLTCWMGLVFHMRLHRLIKENMRHIKQR